MLVASWVGRAVAGAAAGRGGRVGVGRRLVGVRVRVVRPDRRRRPGWTPGSGCYRRRRRTLPSGSGGAGLCYIGGIGGRRVRRVGGGLVGRAVAGAAAGRGGRVGVGRRLVGVRVRVGVLIDVGVLVGLLGLAVTAAVAGRCRLALAGAGLCYIGGVGGRRVRRVGGGLVGRAVAGAAAGRGGRVGVGRRLVGVRVRVGVLIDVGVLVGLLGLAVTAAVAGRCRLALGGAGLCYIGGIGGRRVRRVGGGLVGRAVAGAAAGRGGRVGVGRRLVGVRVRVGVLIDVGVLVGLLGLAVTAAVAGRCRLALVGAGLCYIGGIGGRRVRRVGGGLVGRAVAGAAAGRGGRVGVGRRLVGVRVRVGVLIDVGVLVGLLGLAVTAAVAGRCRLALGGAGLCYIGGIGGRRVRRVGGGLVGRAVAGAAAGRGGRVGVGRRLVGVRVRVGVLIDVGVLVGLLGLAVTAAVAGRCRLALGGAGLCYIGGIGGRRVRRVGGGLVGRAVAGAAAGRGGRVGVGRRLVGVRVRVGVLIDVGVLVGLLGLAVTAAVARRCRLALVGAGLCYIGGIGGRRVRRVGGGLVGRAVAGAAAGRGGRVGVGRRLVGVRVRVGVLIDVGVLVGLLGLAVTAAVAGRCRLALGGAGLCYIGGIGGRRVRRVGGGLVGRAVAGAAAGRGGRVGVGRRLVGVRVRVGVLIDVGVLVGLLGLAVTAAVARRCRLALGGAGLCYIGGIGGRRVRRVGGGLVGRAVAGAAAGRRGRVGVGRRLVGVRVRVGVLIDVGVLVGLLGLAVTAAVARRCRLALVGAGLYYTVAALSAAESAVLVLFWVAVELPPVTTPAPTVTGTLALTPV